MLSCVGEKKLINVLIEGILKASCDVLLLNAYLPNLILQITQALCVWIDSNFTKI